jgi:hypothetical protein
MSQNCARSCSQSTGSYVASTTGLIAVDTTDAMAVLRAQMDDMIMNNSTRVAFLLASPANRRATAPGGYDTRVFDAMVRGPSYAQLLSAGTGTYEVLSHGITSSGDFEASVKVVQGSKTTVYDFGMSLQAASVVDDDVRLEPYQLRAGHPPMWRTDMVMPRI